MKIHKTTEITFREVRERVIRVRANVKTVFCEGCNCPARHFSVEQAAALLGLSELAIFRLVEHGPLHSVESTSGALLICRNSISAIFREDDDGSKANCSKGTL